MSSFALRHVSADAPLIERCAYRIFAASAEPVSDERRRARFRAAALDPGRLERGNAKGNSHAENAAPVPFAVALWLSYLLWLEANLHLCTSRAFNSVTAAEAAGLQALARARARFASDHSFCSRCEAPNPHSAARCRRCSREFSQ